MTQEEYQEWKDDEMYQAREDELQEIKLRTDYEYFEDYFEEKITELVEAKRELERVHALYDWAFDINAY